MAPPTAGPVRPLLKNYTESPLVLAVQEVLNKITKAFDPSVSYVPSAKAMAKMGRDTYSKLEKAGFLLDPDGKYGRLTAGRVVIFQDRRGLSMIDGKIGPAETWPELDKVLGEVALEELRQALRDRPNLSDAKQLVAGGEDCGYFAGMAVAKKVKGVGGASSISFTRADVLAARDAFDPSIPADEQGEERTSGALNILDAVRYLDSLGAPRFSLREMPAFEYATPEKTVAFLDARMNNGAEPVIIALRTFLNASIGHWIALLAKSKIHAFNLYLIYDSSGTLPNTMRDAGSIAGVTTVWVDEHTLTGFFDKGSATKIVSRF